MGLASFNRMRRERLPVARIETQRFMAAHAADQGRRQDRVGRHTELKASVADVRQAESDAMQRIGAKVEAGLDNNDIPLRKDHAAEIEGRNVEGAQQPRNPMDRLNERVPEGQTVNEQLVGTLNADGPGPNPALLQAAREATGRADDRQPERKPEGDGVRRRRADKPAPTDAQRAELLAKRSEVEIPANWPDLAWPRKRALAAKVADGPVMNAADVEAAIKAELTRRG